MKMQITIQKKFLILIEVSLNIYRVFLVIVNFVFNFLTEKIEVVTSEVDIFYNERKEEIRNIWNNLKYKTFNFVRALFGFNIYKLNTLKIKSDLNSKNNNFIKNRNQYFLIYSSLLAPPYKSFK